MSNLIPSNDINYCLECAFRTAKHLKFVTDEHKLAMKAWRDFEISQRNPQVIEYIKWRARMFEDSQILFKKRNGQSLCDTINDCSTFAPCNNLNSNS
jgi:hypothetical protein